MCLKYAVVQFHAVSMYGTNPYKIVPLRWVRDIYGNKVFVQYPSKDEVFTDFQCIVECKTPLPYWKDYSGTLEHVTKSYLDGLIFIRSRRNEFIPEELLFIEYMEKL